MKTISFTGVCPQCSLYDEHILMRENSKFWECPSCSLQILVENDHASILRHRGKGDLRFNHNIFKGNIPFQEVAADSYPNDVEILIEKHLIEYLLLKVDQKEKYSVDNLIDSYEDFRFNGKKSEDYQRQSAHFNIDFDNEEMVEIMQLRDENKNISEQYSTVRLYRFLVDNIFPKYYNSDNSWLPEMGMSQAEMYLSLKHFPNGKRDLINSDPSFVRQSLRNLIRDLIELIYFDKDVVLSYDPAEMLKIKQQKFNNSLH